MATGVIRIDAQTKAVAEYCAGTQGLTTGAWVGVAILKYANAVLAEDPASERAVVARHVKARLKRMDAFLKLTDIEEFLEVTREESDRK